MPEEIREEEELLFGDSAPKKDFEPVDEGEYEVEIVSFEYRDTSTGRKQLNFKLKVREDVEQKNRGRILFYSITKKDGDRAFNFYRVNQLLMATKNCPNYKEKFGKEFDEVLQYLIGRQFKLETTVIDGNNGKPFNQIDGDSFEPSVWNISHPATVKREDGVVTKNVEKLDIPSDDLPF